MDNQTNMLKKSYFYLKDERYPVSNQSLAEIFEEAANREDQNYVTWHRPAERYTYRELYQRSQELAKGLIVAGLKRGDCVFGVGCQGSDGAVMLMAATSIGLVFTCPYLYAPVYKTLSVIMEKLKPSLVLVGDIMTGAMQDKAFMMLNDLLKEYSNTGKTLPLVYYDSISAQSEDCMKCNLYAKPLTLLIEQGSSVAEASLIEERSKTGIKAPSFYTLSSGSTGEPKCVLLGANYFTNSVYIRSERLRLTKENAVVGVMNMTMDDLIFTNDFMSAVKIGYPYVVTPKPANYEDEESAFQEVCECIQQNKITFLNMDQYLTHRVSLDPSYRDRYDLSSVRGWSIGGAPMSDTYKRQLLTHYPDSADIYGMSEIFWLTVPVSGMNKIKLHSVGRPLINIEVKIVDDDRNIVNRGEQGEIFVKAPTMFLGYKDQPELTKSMFTEDGWFKTGDCVRMDEDGDIYFVSRMSRFERFKVYTDVVYAAPIENVLNRHPKIKECSVVGVSISSLSEVAGHEICYCIVPKVTGSMTMDEVKTFAAKNMGDQRDWPMRIVFMDKLPRRGARQKVDKAKLIEMLENEIEADKSLYEVD